MSSKPSYIPGPATASVEPREFSTVRSLLRITRVLSLVLTLLALLIVTLEIVYGVLAAIGGFGFAVPGYVAGAVYFFLTAGVCFFVYVRVPRFESAVAAHTFGSAKEGLLVWAILGFVFGFVVIGVLLIIAYFHLDTMINWYRMGAAPQAPAFSAAQTTPSGGAPPQPVSSAGAVRCPRCGNLGTFVSQYNRYYCYSCQQYI